jgi:DNA-binding IclR family transcriptional regulator
MRSTAIGTMRPQTQVDVALKELCDDIGYTVNVGALDGDRVIYIRRLFGRLSGQCAIDMDYRLGANAPVYCTALGKVLLANISDTELYEMLTGLDLIPHGPRSITISSMLASELERIRTRDEAISDEEFVSGVRSMAILVPRLCREHPIAIEVTVPSNAYTVADLVDVVGPRLRHTAQLISEYRGDRHVHNRWDCNSEYGNVARAGTD